MKSNFLSRFTPSSMTHEALESIFVQRHKLAEYLVELIRESALTPAKHYTLLIGPRGIGKTHLVSLIYHRVRQREDLRERLLIAWLREEEWGVTSYLDLLLSILRALQQEYQDMQLTEPIELLYSSPETAQRDAEALLLDVIGSGSWTLPVVGSPQTPLKKGGFEAPPFGRGGLGGISGATTFDRTRERGVRGDPRTLLLLVENLNDVFDGLGEQGQKQFRAFLQQNDCCTIVATSQSLFNGVKLRESPFYGFFGIRRLKDLPLAEAVQLLAHIAQLEGDAELASYLRTPRGRSRIEAVHYLAGGNHRIYVVFSEFLTRNSLDELVQPFIQMLDNMTSYYQERMGYISRQQRKIVEYLSDANQAVSVEEIGKRCFLDLQTAGSLLKDLQEKGYVSCEKIDNESFYELREPLMRFCLEVKKQRGEPIRLFVDFLRIWYSPKELQQRLDYLPEHAVIEREYLRRALQGVKEASEDHPIAAGEYKLSNSLAKSKDERIAACEEQLDDYLAKNDWSHALEKAEELVEIRGHARDWLIEGCCLGYFGRFHEALASWDKTIEKSEEFDLNNSREIAAIAWGNRGAALIAMERYEEALESCDKAIELNHKDANAWSNRGKALLPNAECHKEALQSFNKTIELEPDNIYAWFDRGQLLIALGRDEEALVSFNKVIDLDPNDANAWYQRGIVLSHLKRYEETLASYEELTKLKPDFATGWCDRGAMEFVLRRFDAALVSCDNAINLNPNKALYWRNRCSILFGLRRYHEALASCDEVIKLEPDNVEGWCMRSYILDNFDRYDEALASSDKAIELDPNYAEAWFRRGWTMDVIGRYDEALASCDRAIELGYQMSNVFFNRTIAILGLNRWDEGIAALDDAFQRLEPDEDAAVVDAELILRHQFDSTRDVATWHLRLPILLELYHKHQAAPILGQALVRAIPMLMSEMVSDFAARSWLEVWQNLAGDRPSFQIPLRLLKTAVQYKEKKGDRRVLLQLPIEERKLLQPLLEKARSAI